MKMYVVSKIQSIIKWEGIVLLRNGQKLSWKLSGIRVVHWSLSKTTTCCWEGKGSFSSAHPSLLQNKTFPPAQKLKSDPSVIHLNAFSSGPTAWDHQPCWEIPEINQALSRDQQDELPCLFQLEKLKFKHLNKGNSVRLGRARLSPDPEGPRAPHAQSCARAPSGTAPALLQHGHGAGTGKPGDGGTSPLPRPSPGRRRRAAAAGKGWVPVRWTWCWSRWGNSWRRPRLPAPPRPPRFRLRWRRCAGARARAPSMVPWRPRGGAGSRGGAVAGKLRPLWKLRPCGSSAPWWGSSAPWRGSSAPWGKLRPGEGNVEAPLWGNRAGTSAILSPSPALFNLSPGAAFKSRGKGTRCWPGGSRNRARGGWTPTSGVPSTGGT